MRISRFVSERLSLLIFNQASKCTLNTCMLLICVQLQATHLASACFRSWDTSVLPFNVIWTSLSLLINCKYKSVLTFPVRTVGRRLVLLQPSRLWQSPAPNRPERQLNELQVQTIGSPPPPPALCNLSIEPNMAIVRNASWWVWILYNLELGERFPFLVITEQRPFFILLP
jgi:hypothetical protein